MRKIKFPQKLNITEAKVSNDLKNLNPKFTH